MGDRLSRQPHPRACRQGRHPPDHRAPGAHRAAHGGCHRPRHLRQEDRHVRHAARPRRRERLRRRRPGLQRVRAHPGDAHGLRPAHGLGRPQLLLLRLHEEHHQVGGAGDVGQGAAERDAARFPAPALRPRRPGPRRGAERSVGRGVRPQGLRVPEDDPHRHRSRRRPRSGQDAGRGQAARDLCRHRRALGGSLGRAQGAGRAAGHPGDDEPRRQERVPGDARPVAGLRRPRHPADGAHLPRQVGPDPRHRLLVHGDQLRRQDAAGRQDHPGDARSLRHQQGHPRRARRGRRCQARAAGPDRRGAEAARQERRRTPRPSRARSPTPTSRGSPSGCRS